MPDGAAGSSAPQADRDRSMVAAAAAAAVGRAIRAFIAWNLSVVICRRSLTARHCCEITEEPMEWLDVRLITFM
ncbi:hypothetical protein GCM10010363_40990 [Streptomyces omiyaensis]|nr:hypothetical protein GCM10010363_40990 [Streptomyces omiyaensis]